jgi:tyrosinase
MTLQVQTQPRLEQATLKTRKSITQMSAAEVTRYRKAVDQMIKRNDNWGYQFYAGWHGVPLGICEHHDPLFLPWHRGYLYHFELGLQQIDPAVTVPWWNWMDEPGIPQAFDVKKVSGGAKNVLASAPIRPMGIPHQPGWPRKTHREPGAPVPPGFAAPLPPPLGQAHLPGSTGGAYGWIMGAPSYSEFMQRCWRVHDNVHVWVGGEMSDQNWAAFDPLFWTHHAMVDRLWRIWQHTHPGAGPDHATLHQQMTFAKAPSFRVSEVLDVKQLGYEYAAQTSTVNGPS